MKKATAFLVSLCLALCLCQTALARMDNINDYYAFADLEGEEVLVGAYMELNRVMAASIRLVVTDTATGRTRTYTERATSDNVAMEEWVPVEGGKSYKFTFTFTAGADQPSETLWVET